MFLFLLLLLLYLLFNFLFIPSHNITSSICEINEKCVYFFTNRIKKREREIHHLVRCCCCMLVVVYLFIYLQLGGAHDPIAVVVEGLVDVQRGNVLSYELVEFAALEHMIEALVVIADDCCSCRSIDLWRWHG